MRVCKWTSSSVASSNWGSVIRRWAPPHPTHTSWWWKSARLHGCEKPVTPKTLSFSAPSSCMGSIGLFFLWTLGLWRIQRIEHQALYKEAWCDASRASEQRLGSGSECRRATTRRRLGVVYNDTNRHKKSGQNQCLGQASQMYALDLSANHVAYVQTLRWLGSWAWFKVTIPTIRRWNPLTPRVK